MLNELKSAAINELLEELIKERYLPFFDPLQDVTSVILSQYTGVSMSVARRTLEQGVKTGKLSKHVARMDSGRRIVAYRKVKHTE
jgi:response regulator of citrate/malate metabolism